MQLLQQWSETNGFLIWLRESPSIWAYPTVFFLHTIGLIFTAGASIIINTRLLGAMPQLPVAPFARFFRPIWIAFWVTAISGVIMVAADLQTKLGNRLFPWARCRLFSHLHGVPMLAPPTQRHCDATPVAL